MNVCGEESLWFVVRGLEVFFLEPSFALDQAGMDQLMEWLSESNVDLQSTLFCMEATGLYRV